ncbi:hypothetical protein F-liban_387 [Faustovirus]|nr:hypothetical protein PRJ_Fausto_00394 [Faustovirus]QBR99299.1 hypothetical protein [Faustovirus mariensis]QJX71135.1 hypothetical protein F-liban_387 [Faustovirus]SME65076.1 Hypothetical protein FSTVST1_377 [Faustovirus ST1]
MFNITRLLVLKIIVVIILAFILFIIVITRALDGRGETYVKDRAAALSYIKQPDPNFLDFKTQFGGDIVDYYEMKRDKK